MGAAAGASCGASSGGGSPGPRATVDASYSEVAGGAPELVAPAALPVAWLFTGIWWTIIVG